jgi:predicted transcriptional regulator of viral defense system
LISVLAERGGLIRPREVEAVGIPREYLLRLLRRGIVERSGRGLYRLTDAPITEHHSLAEVAARLPQATVSLISALAYHEITTQVPHDVWISLPRGSRTPKPDTVSLRVTRVTGPALVEGREGHLIEGVQVMIYAPAKTVVDCFKFRNKVGIDVALEALRECLRFRKATPAEIWRFAQICRVSHVMRPYLEAVTS